MLATHMHVYLPFKLIVRIPLRRGVLDTTLCDKVCQWLAAGLWFSQSTPVSSTNKTDRHDIAEILLKVALNTITLTLLFLHNVNDYSKGQSTSIIDNLSRICLSCLGPVVYLLKRVMPLQSFDCVPDEGYSSNASCVIN